MSEEDEEGEKRENGTSVRIEKGVGKREEEMAGRRDRGTVSLDRESW